MKPLAQILCFLFLLILTPVLAQDKTPATNPQPPIPEPPTIPSRAHLLVDHNTGKVLVEHQADERLDPASLTKIMTAYVVFRELAAGKVALTDEVLISEKAWRTGGSKTFVELGKQIPLEVLLHGMIIQSGNDASVALAEHVAGSEETFASLMNAHAQRLGMTHSHFTNATGLPDPELYTTARDMTLVTAATIREFPEYYAWYSEKEFVYHGIKQNNRNRLLWQDPAVDGVKTGHTETAGYCLVASAKKPDSMRLTSVIMGAKSEKARAQASLALLNYGFRFYESPKLYPGGQPIEKLRIWMGAIEELPVGPASDIHATIPRGRYDKLAARIEKNPDIMAPVAKGDKVGEIVVDLDGKEIGREPLIALQDVAEGGWWEWLRDTVLRWFQ
ncbi:MAG: D-alanyl-D-alanine carboxypeptidase [Chromatiaceae bacterium]|nr:D-alanyl-D-alanine carboxypeptidase [Chromatiaceae bacterium]